MKYFDFWRLDQHDFKFNDSVEYKGERRVISMVSPCGRFLFLDAKQNSGGFHEGPLTRHDLRQH
jgi:hypothetical protein